MVTGGPIDVLTGDYLAELTMKILYDQREQRGAHMGYVGTFLKQVEDVVGLCLEKGIKIVTNAGGLNPEGMAAEVERILEAQGLSARVAYIDGDDLTPIWLTTKPMVNLSLISTKEPDLRNRTMKSSRPTPTLAPGLSRRRWIVAQTL